MYTNDIIYYICDLLMTINVVNTQNCLIICDKNLFKNEKLTFFHTKNYYIEYSFNQQNGLNKLKTIIKTICCEILDFRNNFDKIYGQVFNNIFLD